MLPASASRATRRDSAAAYNKDGTTCVPVEYTFTNNILTNNSVDLKWNVATQPGAAFKYTMTWKPEYVNADHRDAGPRHQGRLVRPDGYDADDAGSRPGLPEPEPARALRDVGVAHRRVQTAISVTRDGDRRRRRRSRSSSAAESTRSG